MAGVNSGVRIVMVGRQMHVKHPEPHKLPRVIRGKTWLKGLWRRVLVCSDRAIYLA